MFGVSLRVGLVALKICSWFAIRKVRKVLWTMKSFEKVSNLLADAR